MTTEIPPPETKAVTIRALDVRKSYEQGAIAVLKGVDLEVRRGEVVALCGPSGCGKSTLLHLAGGLDEPDSGTIEVNGRTLDTRRSMVNFLRHEVGFVFQLHNLIPDLTMEENCLLPAVAAGSSRLEANERLLTLATRIRLEHRLRQRIHKLSGGERQRAAICRALMNRPSILLADEPTGALDERSSAAVFELLLELVRQEGATLLMATHDLTLASTCDRVVQMHDGKIHED